MRFCKKLHYYETNVKLQKKVPIEVYIKKLKVPISKIELYANCLTKNNWNHAKTNQKGTCPIYCKITINKKRKQFLTGNSINPKDWNSKKQLAESKLIIVAY